MQVGEIPKSDEFVLCEKEDNILDILEKVKKVKTGKNPQRVNFILVVDDKKPVGIISYKDIVLKLMNEKKPLGKINAEDVMNSPVMTTKKDRDAKKVLGYMMNMGFRCLPVIDNDGKLVSCISVNDITKYTDKKKTT